MGTFSSIKHSMSAFFSCSIEPHAPQRESCRVTLLPCSADLPPRHCYGPAPVLISRLFPVGAGPERPGAAIFPACTHWVRRGQDMPGYGIALTPLSPLAPGPTSPLVFGSPKNIKPKIKPLYHISPRLVMSVGWVPSRARVRDTMIG